MSGPKECKYFPNSNIYDLALSTMLLAIIKIKKNSHFSISEYILNLLIGVFTLMHKQQTCIWNIQIPLYTEGQLICLVIDNN